MKKEIVISEADDLAVVFEDGKAVEFVLRQGEQLVGDIVLGRVESVVPAIEAAFINIGHDKNGFIHMADLPTAISARKRSKPQPIRTGEKLLVQIAKAPTGTKGARLTGRLSIPGRYLVFVPHDNRVCMSRMITDATERERLRRIASELKDPGHGLIVRTEAAGCSEDELKRDVEELIEKWTEILHGAQLKHPPALLYRDNDLLTRVLRDRLTHDTERIVVDSQDAFQRARQILSSWMPEMVRNLMVHRARTPLMPHYRIASEIESALKPKVNLPSGGSVVIEATEALTVIDVNSGKLTSSKSLNETVLKTNLEAAVEIARQIRLRDIGGIIIVDFISMDYQSDQQKVIAAMTEAIKSDKSRPQITSQFSEHGLMELSRRRQGQSLLEQLTKTCPTCLGLGRLRNEVLPADHVALPAARVETRPARNAEEAAVELVDEILEEPIVIEAPAYPSVGPRMDLADEAEEENQRRRRRRRGRGRGRGGERAEEGTQGLTTSFAGEEEEEEGLIEVAPVVAEPAPSVPGFAFEAMELDTFAPSEEEQFERPARAERQDRERGRGRERGRDRDRGERTERGERGERGGRGRDRDRERPRFEPRPEAPVEVAPVAAAPAVSAGPSPWGEAAQMPAPAVAEVAAAPVRVFRPKSRPRPKMQMIEVAPGVMQMVPVEEGAETPVPVAPVVETAPVAEAPAVEEAAIAPAVEAPVEAEAEAPVVEEAAIEAPVEEAAPVRKTARRRPVKGRATKASAEEAAPEEAPAAAEEPVAPSDVAEAAAPEVAAEPVAAPEAEEAEEGAEEGKSARRAPARRRTTRTRKTKE